MRTRYLLLLTAFTVLFIFRAGVLSVRGAETMSLPVRISWGHTSAAARTFAVTLHTNGVALSGLRPHGVEAEDLQRPGGIDARSGGGDSDGLDVTLVFEPREIVPIEKAQSIWEYLLEHSDPGTVRRLRQDPGFRPDPRRLTVQLNPEGTLGFTLTMDQLLTQRTLWFPELDVLVATGGEPEAFDKVMEQRRASGTRRVLDELEAEPEATYEQYTQRWEDMGNPGYKNSSQVGPGHLVGVAWDSSIQMFGVDRRGGVWNDYGAKYPFHQVIRFPGAEGDSNAAWRGQQLTEGLPVIVTKFEHEGVAFELEQFAYPLDGPPAERRGDMPMVLMQRLRLSELRGRATEVPLEIFQTRALPLGGGSATVSSEGAAWVWRSGGSEGAYATWQGSGIQLRSNAVEMGRQSTNRISLTSRAGLLASLASGATAEWIIKLSYEPLEAAGTVRLLALDYDTARRNTLRFWSEYLDRGARFHVPEEAVNTLYRAGLWHALRLPRRHGGDGREVRIDLPYSNFAYGQEGTPWPVNQAVYVDYHVYDLRGYHDISAEELAAIYRNNQEPSGHVGGFANWGVYTPSMIYTVAQQYLLSGDRARLESLLPQSLRAMEWCLGEVKEAMTKGGSTRGLILAPLNDLSHDAKAWAFNQAYFYAGLDLFGRVLSELDHPRAGECRAAAVALRAAIEHGFGAASMRSPAVPLRDDTWIPYVPADALTPRRMPEIWYPTDIDTGALHLSRLQALDPAGLLTQFLLHDHEDNLFYKGWGMANEPVYNQHAIALLHRGEIKPVIRAFYSMMACAFSHSVFEPVEHRWGWGEYFGPPSTDGAWFDLYRHMLIDERDDTLVLCAAAPRRWFESGKSVEIERAPTYFGTLSMKTSSQSDAGRISMNIDLPARRRPASVLVRLPHPGASPLQGVRVNGKEWKDFDPQSETIRLGNPTEARYQIEARYGP